MSIAAPNSYDELPYDDNCFPYTNPDHLATVGTLYGLPVAPPDACRVLELGCAAGGNLIPAGLEFPGSRLVGVDLSSRQVAAGRVRVEALGLSNVALEAMSLTEIDERFGAFDYVICHGVYSWVAEDVREKILAACSERLAPGGIAYVSYNTYPGWHTRGMVRELLGYHVRGRADAGARVREARDFLEALLAVLPRKSSAYAHNLAAEGEFLRGVGDSYFFHEHLEETNHPLYFHEFMARAEAHGLQFLTEVRPPGLAENLPAECESALAGWAGDDELAREQYVDFLCNRTFRRTLLCHRRAERLRTPSASAVAGLAVSTHLVPTAEAPDVASDAPEEFRQAEGTVRVTTNNPTVKAALAELARVRPRALPVAELGGRVAAALGLAPGLDAERQAVLNGTLLHCFLSNLVELHTRPPRFADAPGPRPTASPLARLQASEGGRVTNLRRRAAEPNDFDRLVLGELDGTRDAAGVLRRLLSRVEAGDFTVYRGDEPVNDPAEVAAALAAQLTESLRRLADLALLTA